VCVFELTNLNLNLNPGARVAVTAALIRVST